MNTKILDGKALAQDLLLRLKAECDGLKARTGRAPRCICVAIGQDPQSGSYGRSQVRAAQAVGIDYSFSQLPPQTSQEELIEHVELLNRDEDVDGIMVAKPVPDGFDFDRVVSHIDPAKDMEGITEANMGRLLLGRGKIVPCTPASVMALIESSGVDIAGKEAVVIGRSEIVGKPVMHLLLQKNATLTVCHSGTSRAGKLEAHVARADVLVVAMGRPEFINGNDVKAGSIVIDVGINSVDGKLVGDVGFAAAARRAAFITPVPGGVGPVTAVMLMKNALEIVKQRIDQHA
ncbi:MAG: bifunctional 5,10-methylenetetrahydrofolate dehydrogenase/5,10-methenyltetrahydrofolate cyclohydrolase [Elusimicrobia bacterium]|nr:bifunctional 5,10-methylenetetrahydrofolate dehydrogenase/5,10-methenyltetrahydrofolate cyclohydrolase [Elusimicrobiota bacterium]